MTTVGWGEIYMWINTDMNEHFRPWNDWNEEKNNIQPPILVCSFITTLGYHSPSKGGYVIRTRQEDIEIVMWKTVCDSDEGEETEIKVNLLYQQQLFLSQE